MKQYLINPLATHDLAEIATYFGDTSLESADRFLQEFDRRCVQLVSFPMSGKGYPQLRPDLRGISFKGYIIFYRLLENGIEIMRVIAGKRDLASIFKN
jgi:toxin ParE1/3/4